MRFAGEHGRVLNETAYAVAASAISRGAKPRTRLAHRVDPRKIGIAGSRRMVGLEEAEECPTQPIEPGAMVTARD